MQTRIVDHEQVIKIIKRMAYQIYERNFDLKDLLIASVNGQGNEIAGLLGEELKKISTIKINYVSIALNKIEPVADEVSLNADVKLSGKTVLLVDDVLNTGRTLIYGMMPFIKAGVKAMQVAVLVDRNHKHFPVHADYRGISLQTTLQQHISVSMQNKKFNVYLD